MPDKYLLEMLNKFQQSPILFIRKMWGLVPQPVKPTYKQKLLNCIRSGHFEKIKAEWFGVFKKGKHITWQQWLILLAVKRAIRGEGSKRISVRSGHGIGKSAVLSWLLLWYLFCHLDSQIPATAPTSDQMHDILWKEIMVWLDRMPDRFKIMYEWQTSYVRMVERPDTWFARGRTARKENPEALAGVHGDYVMYLVDEASGVPEPIFNTAEGALTSGNFFFILISNPTRSTGFFYDTHHRDKANWQILKFDSEESPIVDWEYVERIEEKHGRESDEFRIRVRGAFPHEEALDDKGFVPLLHESDITLTTDGQFVGKKKMGVDPSGTGKNKTTWVVRDRFKAKVVAREDRSNGKSIAQKTLTLMDYYKLKAEDVAFDGFGVGTDAIQELAIVKKKVKAIQVGNQPENKNDARLYLNKRALFSFRMRKWLKTGGELISHKTWKPQLTSLKYRREESDKIKIMSKRDMKKEGIPSPDSSDALMLTFYEEDEKGSRESYQEEEWEAATPYG